MHDWKADVADAEGLIGGGYDAAKMTGVLNAFVAGSDELQARAGGGAQGADIKARFVKFSADAQSALDAVGSKDRVGARLRVLRADCRSCHDVYAN
jgi:cytochrome c556